MDLDAVIQHLRDNVPLFGGRVAGAADLANGLVNQGQMELPAAYVVPLDEDAGDNLNMNTLRQLVTERIGVVVEFDNRADRRGQTVSSLYDLTRTALWGALLNWRIDPVRATRGLEYAGAGLRDWDRARLFYEWRFELTLTVTDRDGWQIVAEPLLEIDVSVVRADTGQVLAGADIPLPQPPLPPSF